MNKLTAILTDLRAAIAARAARDRAMTAVLVLVWGRLARAAGRLERLYGLWLAGKLLAPRQAGRRKGVARAIARPRLPGGLGWLAIQVWETRAYGSQLQHLLAEPGFAAFVAAVPRAGRVLRSVLRMLTVDARPATPASPVGKIAAVKARPGRASVETVWPRKSWPEVPKGAWFAPPGKNWGSAG